MKMDRPGADAEGIRRGAIVSGTAHAALLALALWGADFFAPRDAVPLVATDVTIIDATEFMASLSTAPIVPNEGPAELSPPDPSESVPETPEAEALPSTAVPMSSAPAPRPPEDKRPEIVLPPPPLVVPSERVAPSIAEIPVPDQMPFEAPTPESPPSTETMTAAAPRAAVLPAPAPAPPPLPEPVPAEQPEPEPEPELEEPDPASPAPAEIEAPEGPAPRVATLPVAKPADLAAAARAADAAAPPPAPETPTETRTATAEPTPASSTSETPSTGGSTAVRGPKMSLSETRGMSLSIKKYLVYNGDVSDRSLMVVVRVGLSEDGRIISGPSLRKDGGSNANARKALYSAAVRALKRAEAAGEFRKLPREKYEAWKVIDFVFTPEGVKTS